MSSAAALPAGYEISTDPARIDIDHVHRYLSNESYWAGGIPRDMVARSIENSLPFGLFGPEGQVGFGRVITDRTTFAWLCDVFIDSSQQGKGLGKALVETILAHPDLQRLRRFMLVTKDAHTLYERHGFAVVDRPDRLLAIVRTDLHKPA